MRFWLREVWVGILFCAPLLDGVRFEEAIWNPARRCSQSHGQPACNLRESWTGLFLRGGAAMQDGASENLHTGRANLVVDMRSPQEKELEEAAMKELKRAREAMGPPDSWRTQRDKAYVREQLEELLASHPDLNITEDEVMDEWGEMYGDDVIEKQLVDAAVEDDEQELERLLDLHPEAINRTWAGRSALMTAAYQGHLACVCLLVERGIDLEIRTDVNWTALHYAVSSGRPLVVEVLLRAGAAVNVHDSYRDPVRKLEDMGVSPLHVARRWMERAGAEEHPLFDPRGGDAYWRIEQMLKAYGAKEWLTRTPDRMGQSIRVAWEDSDLEKNLMGVPLSDAEKEWLVPSWNHPDNVQFRRMMADRVDPQNVSYFAELDRQRKDADRSSSETETDTEAFEGDAADWAGVTADEPRVFGNDTFAELLRRRPGEDAEEDRKAEELLDEMWGWMQQEKK